MKVAVVTGTRAEYGLLAPLMRKINAAHEMDLQLLVTGAHLLPEFGSTIGEIRSDGFSVTRVIPEVGSASRGAEVSRQVGAGTVAFTDAMEDLSPDVLVLLGDRFELLAAATAAFFLKIPILHIHGGEVTHGAFDDPIRHAISKFAHIHAVAAPEYAERLFRMGEQPQSVHVVGGFGIDVLSQVARLSRSQLEHELGVEILPPFALVTYHPVTALRHDTAREVEALLNALEAVSLGSVIFTFPNADPENLIVSQAIQARISKQPSWHVFLSLGTEKYLSLLAHASVVVGNSSSGLLEAPSFGTPTVNIGPRQTGRLMADSVISCEAETPEISAAMKMALSPDFVRAAARVQNPYGSAGASDRVMHILHTTNFGNLDAKIFFDAEDRGWGLDRART